MINNLTKLYRRSPKYFKNRVNFNSVITQFTDNKKQFDFLDKLCKLDVTPINVVESDYFLEYINTHKDELKTNNNVDQMAYPFLRKGILKEAEKYHSAYTASGTERIKIFPGAFCIPGTRRNFVSTDGKFMICERVDDYNNDFCIGDVNTGIDINKVEKLVNITKEKVDRCKSCWAAKFCDCCFKDIFNINDNFCQNKKKEIEESIVNYLKNFKNNNNITGLLENFF